ncbi:MAG: SLBB domain-containing protein [Kiritimatiellae bacterium]|nr:SLBB domain-containing protein [Kiritimatiellia bacterium]
MSTRFNRLNFVCGLLLFVLSVMVAPSSIVVAQDVGASKVRAVMAGDRLRIDVAEDESLSKTYAVAGDGTIDFGFAGRVPVDNETPADVATRLKKLLEQSFYKKATVSVTVEEFVEGSILMVGALGSPGALEFKGDQILTLMEAIARSGGLLPQADGKNVRILRWRPQGGLERQIITVDVKSMVETLDFSADQYLRPRDMIFVPTLGAGEGAAEILALGEFGSPGFHPYKPNMDMIRAVAQAGGLTREARMDAVRLLRPSGKEGEYQAIPIDLSRLFGSADMQMNIPVQPGDILFAPTTAQSSGGHIYLLGEVASPGIYPLPLQGDATLARTLLANGGLGKFANASRVKIQRSAPNGRRESLEVDVGNILKTGAFENDVPLRDEDVVIVPERGIF